MTIPNLSDIVGNSDTEGSEFYKYVWDPLQKSLGQRDPSVSESSKKVTTPEQDEALTKAFTALGGTDPGQYVDYVPGGGPGAYSGLDLSGVKNPEFAGVWDNISKPTSPDWQQYTTPYSAKTLKDFKTMESYQSIEGLDELRRFSARNTVDVSDQIKALMGIGKGEFETSYDARVAKTLERANQALSRADTANVRELGMMGGSSRDAALRAMGQNYASTIGREAAVAAEENQFNRLQLAAGAIGTAGELQYRQGMAGMTAQELDLRARGQDATYNLGRGELEAKQAMYAHGAEQQGLQFLQGLSQEDRQYAARHGLARAGLGLQQYGIDAGIYGTDVGARSSRYGTDTQRYGIDAGLVSNLRNIMSRENIAMNQYNLSADQLKELSNYRAAQLRNTTNLQRWQNYINQYNYMGNLATKPLMQHNTTVNQGSAGLLPGLINAGAKIIAAKAMGPSAALLPDIVPTSTGGQSSYWNDNVQELDDIPRGTAS